MTRQFSPGDVVVLRSGGPNMTVHKVDTWPDGSPAIHCDWFEGTTKRGGVFRAEQLDHIDE